MQIHFKCNNDANVRYLIKGSSKKSRKSILFFPESIFRVTLLFELKKHYGKIPVTCDCFISWPEGGLIEPADISTPTQVMDLLPTLTDMCKINAPQDAEFDGSSLLPLLKGKEHELEDRMFVVQYQQNNLKKYDATVIWKKWRLVLPWGDQLFNVETDPDQDSIVSEAHPDIVKKMKDFYEQWWAEIEPSLDKIVYNHVGTKEQPEAILNSSDWMDVRADGNGVARQAGGRPKTGTEFTGGIWYIDIEKAGEYTIELRRYPREANASICGELQPFVPRFGKPEPAGVAIDATKAFLETASGIQSAKISIEDNAVIFKADFEEGPTKIRAWFGNEQDDIACGAYYAYVKRK